MAASRKYGRLSLQSEKQGECQQKPIYSSGESWTGSAYKSMLIKCCDCMVVLQTFSLKLYCFSDWAWAGIVHQRSSSRSSIITIIKHHQVRLVIQTTGQGGGAGCQVRAAAAVPEVYQPMWPSGWTWSWARGRSRQVSRFIYCISFTNLLF